ncbi:MAG: hypothetical protein IJQ81_12030 [Oscillibacter sp.]|nr:hypothetical protein [Oscillibacter sp.]
MEGNFVERGVFEEYQRRLEDQKRRWDKRLEVLENNVQQIHALTANIEKLTISVQNMAQAQAEYGERLKAIENRDGEMWRKIVGYALTAGAGFLLAALLRRAGIF